MCVCVWGHGHETRKEIIRGEEELLGSKGSEKVIDYVDVQAQRNETKGSRGHSEGSRSVRTQSEQTTRTHTCKMSLGNKPLTSPQGNLYPTLKAEFTASDLAHQAAFAANPDGSSSNPRSLMVEGEKEHPQFVLCPPHTHHGTHSPPHIHAHTDINK